MTASFATFGELVAALGVVEIVAARRGRRWTGNVRFVVANGQREPSTDIQQGPISGNHGVSSSMVTTKTAAAFIAPRRATQ